MGNQGQIRSQLLILCNRLQLAKAKLECKILKMYTWITVMQPSHPQCNNSPRSETETWAINPSILPCLESVTISLGMRTMISILWINQIEACNSFRIIMPVKLIQLGETPSTWVITSCKNRVENLTIIQFEESRRNNSMALIKWEWCRRCPLLKGATIWIQII